MGNISLGFCIFGVYFVQLSPGNNSSTLAKKIACTIITGLLILHAVIVSFPHACFSAAYSVNSSVHSVSVEWCKYVDFRHDSYVFS